jgi:inorganic pyrophosphatase
MPLAMSGDRLIEGEQGKKKQSIRNDRIVAVEGENQSYAHIRHIKDLGKEFVEELEEFFVNYHELSGKKYRIVDVCGPREARRRIKDGVREAKNG